MFFTSKRWTRILEIENNLTNIGAMIMARGQKKSVEVKPNTENNNTETQTEENKVPDNTETQENTGDQKPEENPTPVVLIGSDTQPAIFNLLDGTEKQLGDIVADAHEKSEMTIEAWNELEAEAREKFIAAEVDALELAPTEEELAAQKAKDEQDKADEAAKAEQDKQDAKDAEAGKIPKKLVTTCQIKEGGKVLKVGSVYKGKNAAQLFRDGALKGA